MDVSSRRWHPTNRSDPGEGVSGDGSPAEGAASKDSRQLCVSVCVYVCVCVSVCVCVCECEKRDRLSCSDGPHTGFLCETITLKVAAIFSRRESNASQTSMRLEPWQPPL